MESSLLEPRDKGGSIASNRLDYQKDWSLCKLLEVHESGRAYVFIFEHDDDLMIAEDSDEPQLIDFFQVKTKDSGNWKLAELLRRHKSKTRASASYLGRLYANKIKYSTASKSLNFVSNAKFDLKKTSKGGGLKQIEICLSDCQANDKDAINSALKIEHNLASDADVGDIYLHVASLSLHDSQSHALGGVSMP